MVRCSECRHLEPRIRVVPVGPPEPGAVPTTAVRYEHWFTCPKVNETVNETISKYGFRGEEYEISEHEVNEDRPCPDFESR